MSRSALADLFRQSGQQGRRIGRRIATPTLWLDWQPAVVQSRRRRWRGQRPTTELRARVLDLSITGAKVLAASEEPLRVGSPVRVGLYEAAGRGVVRRAQPAAEGLTMYGIEFVEQDPTFRNTVNDLVAADRGALEQRWQHAP